MGKAIDTCRDNLGYFNPPNVYRPAIIDIRLVGEYSAEDGATNTYRITQNDGKVFEFDVKNGSGGSAGRSVTSVEQIQISTESLGKNIARIHLSDGTYTDVEIRNGAQGRPGPPGDRGPAGIDHVEATVDDAVGTPSVDTSVVDGMLHLDFHNMKGVQGEPAVGIENYVTVEATAQTTAATDVLPATGSADTLYRVACWDGAQYDTTVYSVYGWYNGAYKFLEKKEVGIDDEPTAGSQKLVKSGGVAAQLSQLGQEVQQLPTRQVGYWSNSQNQYISTGGYTLFIPIVGYSSIKVKGRSSVAGEVAFVTAFTATSVSFVSGVSGTTTIAANAEQTFTVPSDAKYLLVLDTSAQNQDRKPSSIIADGYRDLYKGQFADLWDETNNNKEVCRSLEKDVEFAVQNPITQDGFWSNSQNKYVTNSGKSLFVPCSMYKTIKLVGQTSSSGYSGEFAFVKAFTNNSVTFVDGATGTTTLNIGATVERTVPSDAEYLMLFAKDGSNNDRLPSSIIGDGQRNLYKNFVEDMVPVKTMPSVLYADGVEYKNGTISWTSIALLLPGGIVKNISSSSVQFTSGVLVYRPSSESTMVITDSTKFIVGDVVLLQIRNGFNVGGLLFPYIKNERPLIIAATNLVFDGALVSWDSLSILRNDGVVSNIGQSSYTLSAEMPILVYNKNLDNITTRIAFGNVQNTDVLLLYYRGGKCVAGELLGYYLNYNNGKYPIVLSATNIAFDNNSLSWDSISIKLPDGSVATVGEKSYNIGVGAPIIVYRPSQGDTRQLNSFSNIISGDILLAYYKINYGIIEGELTAYLLKNSLKNDVHENGINLNIFRRGKQLRDVKYTARGNFIAGEGTHVSGVEYQGVPYSSVKEYLKFVGIDVSLHTFMTTMHDEHSLQYTERPLGTGSVSAYGRTYHGVNCLCYFGNVCSAFVTTALGRLVQDNSWEYKSFFERYKVLPNQDPENFLVGDILSMNGHCSIITNLQRRDDGTIETFYVSEQVAASLTSPIVTRAYTMATLKNRMYTSEEKACRYDFLPLHTQYAPSVFVLAEGENLYRYGDIVFFDGVSERTFKRCIRENRDSTFDSTKWEDIPEWEANVLYTIGKYVSYGEDVYRAPASIQTAIFDVSMWERITNAFEWTPYPYVYNDDIITFAGDRAAFRTNDLIFINYNKGDYTNLQLYKDGVLIQTLSIPEGYQVDVSSYCASAGMYKARLTDGVNYSRYTYFEVVDTTVSANYANNEATIQFSSVNGKPLEFQIVEESGYPIVHDEFTEQELSNGEIVLNPMALLYVLRHIYWGRYSNDNPKMYARVVFAGEYGNVVNEMIEIGVVNAIEGDIVFPDKTMDFGTISGNKNIILAGRLTNNTYVFSFVVGSSATISVLPAYGEIMWANGSPAYSQGKMYLLQISNGIGKYTEI